MILTENQRAHVGWLTARDEETFICRMAEAGHTKHEIMTAFPTLSHAALLECLRQNYITNLGKKNSGKRGKDKNKRRRRTATTIRLAGGKTAIDRRWDAYYLAKGFEEIDQIPE